MAYLWKIVDVNRIEGGYRVHFKARVSVSLGIVKYDFQAQMPIRQQFRIVARIAYEKARGGFEGLGFDLPHGEILRYFPDLQPLLKWDSVYPDELAGVELQEFEAMLVRIRGWMPVYVGVV